MGKYITQRVCPGPIIEACDFDQVQQILAADEAYDGVELTGKLVLTIESDNITPEKADEIVKGLAESLAFDEE